MGLMKCPNCEVIEEDGLWMNIANSEDGERSDEDEDEESNNEEQYNEQHGIIVYLPYLLSNHRNGFLSKIFIFIDIDLLILWRQQLHVPPPPTALEMIDQRIFISGLNVDSDLVSHESPTLYEQTYNNVFPCLELTLAIISSSVSDGCPPPPCQCISCRASSRKMH
ncbi:hypothetical protein RDI58_007431 [Solanum bulbocastanum]|uniref:Uncharacterized protein n=1 Tax=Solanum bulbocastanum TaxID=147425 RepID=A0AAN8YM49_SOLBU